MSKDLIKKMLNALSPEELKELMSDLEPNDKDVDVDFQKLGIDESDLTPEEIQQLKEATAHDKQLPPVKKSFRSYPFVDVQCRVCGKREKVSRKLVRGSYKCNDCCCKPG